MAIYVFACSDEKCEQYDVNTEVIVHKSFEDEEDSKKYVEEHKMVCGVCGKPLRWVEWVKNSFKINFAPFA